MMRRPLILVLAAGTAASLGCAGAAEPELGAEPQTTTLAVNDATIGSRAGVQIRVMPVMQTSRYQNEMDYRPANVEIRNQSGRPLRIRYDAFALESGGEEFDAVPVYRLDLTGGMPGIGGLPPAAWEHREFSVAGEYAEMFPDLPTYEGEFQTTTVDAYRAPGAAEAAGFRDRALLADVIPEGVIASGGRVEGTMWFDIDDADADSTLVFSATLVDAASGEEFGEISVPFDLTRAGVRPGSEMWEARAAGDAEPVDVMVVVNAPDPAAYAERTVQLQNVKVQGVVSDRVFWVGPDGGQWLLVTHGDPGAAGPISAAPLQVGQTVTLVGTLRAPPSASEARAVWGLDQTGADMLGRSSLYLIADDVRAY